MTITEVINVCAGFKDHQACSRTDNSHGYWGSCSNDNPSVDNDCSYFSHIYYRDPNINNFSVILKNKNTTYRKIQEINIANTICINLKPNLLINPPAIRGNIMLGNA